MNCSGCVCCLLIPRALWYVCLSLCMEYQTLPSTAKVICGTWQAIQYTHKTHCKLFVNSNTHLYPNAQNEAMTGIFDYNPVFSRLSLAVLEDSGWYTVDYTAAKDLPWGRGRGCDFVRRGCGDMLEWDLLLWHIQWNIWIRDTSGTSEKIPLFINLEHY